MKPKAYQARETWLADAMATIRKHFDSCNYLIPDAVRVSCGLPSGRAFSPGKRVISEAWSSTSSGDKHFEIFISPTIDDPFQVLSVLVHELVHVTVGLECGHRGGFIECAGKVGLVGPWTATEASDELANRLHELKKQLGPYPHASLSKMTNGKKKQTTRLLKVGCATCGYTTRISLMWVLLAIPTCPNEHCEDHGKQFEVVYPEGIEEPKEELTDL